jgi:glycosyltransferase involved in cell wall biosynthesis
MAGHEVTLASRFRSHDGMGDGLRQRRLQELGGRLAERLLRRYRDLPADRRPEAWFTYHLYHKAPDWLGPSVTEALRIPYLIAEASFAPKQEKGPWATGHAAAARAIERADIVFGLNRADEECVRPLLRASARLVPLPPFLDTRPYAEAAGARAENRRTLARRLGIDPAPPWILAVAMMRSGDKLESYRRLAASLSRLEARPWRLVVAGDGVARPEVEAALKSLRERVHWLGEQPVDALPALYAASDLLAWPAVNEAYGMVLLEAQAAGLPVVAGRYGGVADIVEEGRTGLLAPPEDVAAFADGLGALLDDAVLRRRMGEAALAHAARKHGIAPAAHRLSTALKDLLAGASP